MEVSRVDQRLGSVVALMPVPLPEAAKAEVGNRVSKVKRANIADMIRVFHVFIELISFQFFIIEKQAV